MASRFFLKSGAVEGDRIEITGTDFHHLKRVLRLKEGDRIEAVDSAGRLFLAEIEAIELEAAFCRIINEKSLEEGRRGHVVLFQGLPKGSKMDAVVRGSVEVGVDRIVPLMTERSVPELDSSKKEKKVERWRRIAVEASKQAKRMSAVDVDPPTDLADVMAELNEFDALLVFWEEERAAYPFDLLRPGLRSVGVFVGPEGGFSRREVELLEEKGARPVTLGESILRTETAGVVACAVTLYELARLAR